MGRECQQVSLGVGVWGKEFPLPGHAHAKSLKSGPSGSFVPVCAVLLLLLMLQYVSFVGDQSAPENGKQEQEQEQAQEWEQAQESPLR